MQLFPVLAIMLPLLGAGGALGVSYVPRVRRYSRYIALPAVGFATLLILTFRWTVPGMVIPSLWQPSLLFGVTLALRIDAAVQPLAFALALVTCCSIFVDLSRTEESSPRLLAILQALLAAGLLALWSANPLTTLIGWAIYDLLQAAGLVAAGGSARAAVRSLIFGVLATLLLWGGTLLAEDGAGSGLWALMTPSSTQMTLWAAAGVMRLWAYPFHLVAPGNDASPLVVALSLGPVVGWGLWLRLAMANNGVIPSVPWVLILGAVNLGMGGFLGWCCESRRRTLSWVGMAATGAILLAAGLAEDGAAAVVSAGSVAWTLGMGVTSLSDGWQRNAPWWSLPPLVGALVLLGLPFTLGFAMEANLIGGLTGAGSLGWGSAFFLGNMLLVPSLIRGLVSTPSAAWATGHWPHVARGIGLGLPTLLLMMAGLYPPLIVDGVTIPSLAQLFAMPGLTGWLLWLVSLAGGAVLAWQDATLCPKIALWLTALHDLLSLDWLYSTVAGALERGFGVLRAADRVVRGGGALLWSWLLFLLILLVWSSR